MIQKLEISGVHMDVGDDLRKYVVKKIGRLDRYVSRHARVSLHAEIKLKEGKNKGKSERTCEVVLFAPHEVLTVNETTINIYAAVDIAEEKLKTQLKKYKDAHAGPQLHRRVLARLKREES
ncbi:MAG TPA: ribosome-associated translation inhibitor RaiA [Candidatus Saccharimonadales bacterium]